jgi:ech hydrogenase subunit D
MTNDETRTCAPQPERLSSSTGLKASSFVIPSSLGIRHSSFVIPYGMHQEQTLELIAVDALLDKIQGMRQQGYRLVQISATRLPEQLELTYSFALDGRVAQFRLHLADEALRVPSVSSIYWSAFLYENEMHDLFNLTVEGMAVDFKGTFYKTAVKYPFGSTKVPRLNDEGRMTKAE